MLVGWCKVRNQKYTASYVHNGHLVGAGCDFLVNPSGAVRLRMWIGRNTDKLSGYLPGGTDQVA